MSVFGPMSTDANRPQIMNLGSHDFDIQQLLEYELQLLEARIKPHEDRISMFNQEKKAWESLNSNLNSLNELLEDVRELSNQDKSVDANDSTAITATATGNASDGNYSIQVDRLATNHRVAGTSFLNEKVDFDEIVMINGKELQINEGDSLRDIAKSISSGEYGVDAIVLNNQLVLTSQTSGEDGEIELSSDRLFQEVGIINDDGDFINEIETAIDASYSINGIEFTSSSNVVDEIEGLSITLKETTNEPVNFSVEQSTKDMVEKIKKFVTGYNQMMDVFEELSGEGRELQGKGVPRTIRNEMNMLMSRVGPAGMMLSDLGISFDRTKGKGKLELNEEILTDALSTNEKDTLDFLEGKNGFVSGLQNIIQRATDSSGMISSETKSIEDKIKRSEQSIDRIESTSERNRESMIKKYAQLEVMLNQMEIQNKMMMAQIELRNQG